MNQIARQLKEKNIAEYLIYMWQEEDLIRANHGELEEIEANVIARYPEDQRPALREWYGNLITMMNEEGVREKGHLQINKNIIINLTELHNALTSSPKFPFYSAAYFKALPFIVELRNKNGKKKSRNWRLASKHSMDYFASSAEKACQRGDYEGGRSYQQLSFHVGKLLR